MSRMDGRAGGGHYNQGPPPQLDPTFSIFSDDCLMKARVDDLYTSHIALQDETDDSSDGPT